MTFDRTEHEVLVCCARTVLNSGIAARLAGLLRQEIDWDYLLRMAVDHGTVPLLYRHLQVIGQDAVPDESLSQLRDHFNENVRHNLFLTGELIKVLDLFEAHQVTAIPFKGPTLAGCAYGNLALRKFNDLDLLICERDVPKAKKLLLGEGYRLQLHLTAAQETAYLQTICQLPLVRDDGGFVELHTRITPRDFAFDMPVQQLVERLVPVCVAGKQLRTFSPEDLLLVLCVHGAKHLWGCLGRICDVAELIRTHPGIQWVEVLDQARRLHVERMLFLGLSLARGLLGAPVPEPVLQRTNADLVVASLAVQVRQRLFREQDASINGLESSMFHLKARERLRDGLRYCRSLAMTPTVSDWTAISLPRCLFPFYPLLRLGRLVRKYGSRLIRIMRGPGKPKQCVELKPEAQAKQSPTASFACASGFDRAGIKPRRWRRFAVLVGILVLVYVFRAPLLSGVAGGLVVNESGEPADWALVLGGDRCYEEAARLHHEGTVRGILLIEFAPSRLVRIGVLQSDEELARRALNSHELPETTIDMVRDEAKSMWEAARHLDEWMTQHPGHRLRVLCRRFAGREQRWLFSRVLGADRAATLSWHPLRDRRYDETSWWHRKEGVLDVFNSYVSLGYVWLNGEQPSTWHEWNAEEWLAASLEIDRERE